MNLMENLDPQQSNTVIARECDDRVDLNVGGTLFSTSVKTVQASPTLWKHLTQQTMSRTIFIDRDPKTFTVILNHMRQTDNQNDSTKTSLEALDVASLKELIAESEYYQLLDLSKCIQKELNSRKKRHHDSSSWLKQSMMKLMLAFGSKTLHRLMFMPALRNYLKTILEKRQFKVLFWQLIRFALIVLNHIQVNIYRLHRDQFTVPFNLTKLLKYTIKK